MSSRLTLLTTRPVIFLPHEQVDVQLEAKKLLRFLYSFVPEKVLVEAFDMIDIDAERINWNEHFMVESDVVEIIHIKPDEVSFVEMSYSNNGRRVLK